ncbi:hypothetical protein D9619_002650 [Psilocybe cf. subviscida]|uniref:Methyltransferase domain-containing protein n=1 Tax=Psilocybe cf. subviscida TaxID=2480587 RepID=A0A8H5AWS7_9AGAR|nr:hypothetical protein D9619_002650 [Psilocybe cf. subviscida]
MGLNFTGGKDKDKGKAKEEPSPSTRPAGVSEFGIFKTPGKARLPKSPLGGGDALPQRPSTSSGVTTVRASPAASTSNPKNTFFRMKKKRSMASIFSSAPSESGSATGSSSGSSSSATVLGSPDLPGSPNSTSSVFSSTGSTTSSGTSSSSFTTTTPTTSSPLASHHVIPSSPRSDSDATIKTSGHNKAVVGGEDGNIFDLDARAFVRKTNWAMRQNMTMHPYQDEYPYMRSYDPVLLESDRHTDMLLQHLSQGAPSFHDYRSPPATALDLGCGVGYWALNAANVWKGSQITGFDLVNITSPAFEHTENLHFVQGSFLDNPLPFADGSFEFVRMANLILCIPHDKWSAVLAEIYRVLAPGGRLEVVDDEMCFPYADKPRERKRHGKKRSVSSFEESDSDASDNLFEDSRPKRSDDDSTETESTFFSETSSRPTSFDSKGSHNGSVPLLQISDKDNKEEDDKEAGLSESVTVRPISAMTGRGPMSAFLPPTPPFATPPEPAVFRSDKRPAETVIESYQHHAQAPQDLWERQAWASRDMERIFDMMLGQTYGVFPRFADRSIVDVMQGVFGEGAAGKVSSFHVKLAPADSPIGAQARARAALEAVEEVFEMKKGWKMTKTHGEKEKERDRDRKTSGAKKDESFQSDSPTGSAAPSKRSSMDVSLMLSTPLPASLNAKAAARLGLPSTTNIKAAHRLGYDLSPDKASFSTDKNKKLPKTPYDNVDSSDDDEETLVGNEKDRSPSPRPPSIKISSSPPSSAPPTPTTLTPNTPIAATSTIPIPAIAPTPTFNLPPAPLVINAKAAMRLGIQPSPGEKMPKTPGSGQNHSLQSPGILIWPSTYIAMSPVELEMHACKNVHTLLGCRPALYEFVRKQMDKEGKRLASDEEFADAIWEYECFRRSRLNWPSPSMDSYDDDTTSTGTETVNISNRTILPIGNQDSFNGQYLRNSLVHLRTIRVFSAVKTYVEDKSPTVTSSATLSPPSSFRPPKATPMIKSSRGLLLPSTLAVHIPGATAFRNTTPSLLFLS